MPLALGCTSILTGCAGQTAPAKKSAQVNPTLADAPPRTDFLREYSNLRKTSTDANTWLERSPEIDRYGRFVIDPVKVYPKATVRGVPLDAESTSLLSNEFQIALRQSIAGAFTVADAPGPGVARVRAAVTEVAIYKPADGTRDAEMGGAAMELEIVDSVSGKRLFAIIDSGSVSSYDNPPVPTRRFEHARITFRHWASRLIIRMGAYDGDEKSR